MKFSKYTFKAVTFRSWPYFKSSNNCLSNKATTIRGHSAAILRSVPVRLNRRGVFTEIKVRFAPPTMCRLTIEVINLSIIPHSSLSIVFTF